MQYQVFKKETGEIVAWIDSETGDSVCYKGYEVKAGNQLPIKTYHDLGQVYANKEDTEDN